ncbi:MAG: hypothetical protein ACRDPK_12460 [Carbonactinosporaceae bacterium]
MPTHRVPRSGTAVLVLVTLGLLGLAVGGCASGEAGSAQARTTQPPAAGGEATRTPDEGTPRTAAAKTVRITIAKGEVSPAPDRVPVDLGEQLRIVVRSDQADEVHVHGYDAEARVTPAAPATLTFTADQPGLFDVETHESHQVLVQLEVSG